MFKPFTLPFVLLFCFCSVLNAQVAKNIQRGGFIDTETLYQKVDPTRVIDFTTQYVISDVWGWSFNGNEYALIGLQSNRAIKDPPGPYLGGSGVALIDVTDPTNIVHIKTIRYPGGDSRNAPKDIKVWNNYAFVAQQGIPTYYVDLPTAILNQTNIDDPSAGVADNDIISNDVIHNLQIDENGLLFLSNFRKDKVIDVFDVNGSVSNFSTSIGSVPVIPGARSHDMHVKGGRVYDAEGWGSYIFDGKDDPGGAVITDFSYMGSVLTAVRNGAIYITADVAKTLTISFLQLELLVWKIMMKI